MGRCDSGWEPRIAEQDYQSFLGFCVFVSLSLSLCSLVCERLGGGLSMMSSLCAVLLDEKQFSKNQPAGNASKWVWASVGGRV